MKILFSSFGQFTESEADQVIDLSTQTSSWKDGKRIIRPGYKIFVKGQATKLELVSWWGTEELPVLIYFDSINLIGPSQVLRFENLNNVKVFGYAYCETTGYTQPVVLSPKPNTSEKTTSLQAGGNVSISGLHINGKSRSSALFRIHPLNTAELNDGSYIFDGLEISHCTLENGLDEGFYIGIGDETKNYHRFGGVYVHDNVIRNTGKNGLQVGYCNDVSIASNRFENCGSRRIAGDRTSIDISSGVKDWKIVRNVIEGSYESIAVFTGSTGGNGEMYFNAIRNEHKDTPSVMYIRYGNDVEYNIHDNFFMVANPSKLIVEDKKTTQILLTENNRVEDVSDRSLEGIVEELASPIKYTQVDLDKAEAIGFERGKKYIRDKVNEL